VIMLMMFVICAAYPFLRFKMETRVGRECAVSSGNIEKFLNEF
jgi:hypothetical protein